jgi:hypothetical protein
VKKIIIQKLKKNIYLYFLTKIFILFLIVFSLDFIIGSLLQTLYFRQESGFLYRTTYSLEKTTEDLLIFGSSTANHNYSPQIFTDRLKISSYNVGRDGTSIFYDYAILKGTLKRYLPKIIILNFDLDEFTKTAESYDRLSILLPYYKRDPEIRSILELRSSYEKIKRHSKIYPYNSFIFSILAGDAKFNKKRRQDYNGFVPLTNIHKKPLQKRHFEKQELDSNKINIYQSFIEDCTKANIKLYVFCSPNFSKADDSSSSVIEGEKIANAHNIPFVDYSQDSTFINNPPLFSDIGHLNHKGAFIFSNMVVDKITSENKK